MTIELQLERICVALEVLAAHVANPLITANASEQDRVVQDAVKAIAASHKAEPKAETKKAETKKEEPKNNPETPSAESEVTNKASFDDLADKVKALGRTNRDSVVTLFKQFGIERLGGLEEKDYIAFDIAIAKAINASKGE